MKDYFRTIYPINDDSQHDIRREVTDILLSDNLIDLVNDKPSKVFLVINQKGCDVVSSGGYEKYLQKRGTQTNRQNEMEDMTYRKLKYDTANSRRMFRTCWFTFGFAVAALIISLILLVLRLKEQ